MNSSSLSRPSSACLKASRRMAILIELAWGKTSRSLMRKVFPVSRSFRARPRTPSRPASTSRTEAWNLASRRAGKRLSVGAAGDADAPRTTRMKAVVSLRMCPPLLIHLPVSMARHRGQATKVPLLPPAPPAPVPTVPPLQTAGPPPLRGASGRPSSPPDDPRNREKIPRCWLTLPDGQIGCQTGKGRIMGCGRSG